jgi:hypothetical protein
MRNLFIKILTATIASLMTVSAMAQETANFGAEHALLVNVGFSEGGMALGADYENGISRTFGLGGYLRLYPDNDDNKVNTAATINAFGVFIRPHFTRQQWDLYVSPGFGVVQYENKRTNPDIDETTLGPVLMTGLLYQFSGAMAFGVEHMSIYAWMEEEIRGKVSDELLAKFRFSF